MANHDQQTFWADTVGAIWVARTREIDATFAPVLHAVLDAADLQDGDRVLDIGCGAGSSSFAAAERVGAQGRVCGLDISAPLLQAARHDPRASDAVSFLCADAQTHAVPQAGFDAMISRFGVMFFDDPTQAFGNIAKGLTPGGRMAFATWGRIAENPFFTFPAQLARTHIGSMPKSDPDAPGPFSMRDTDKTLGILTAAGLRDVQVSVQQMRLTPAGSALEVAELLCDIGPAKSALAHFDASPATRAAFIRTLADALEVYATPNGIAIPAEINIFCAKKP